MDQANVFNNVVPEDPLEASRLTTNEEREKNQQSVAPSNINLPDLGEQISNLRLHIQEVKAQVAQMEGELRDLCDAEAAAMEASTMNRGAPSSLHHSKMLTVPTLEDFCLDTRQQDVPEFPVSWANLTVLHIHGDSWVPESAIQSIAYILRQTTHLVTCSVSIGFNADIGYTGEIFLPHLQFLSVRESVMYDSPGLLKFINAPVLEALDLGGLFPTSSLSTLLQRSLILQRLDLEFDMDHFWGLTQSLYYCPSLKSLFISRSRRYGDRLKYWNQYFPPTFSDAFFEASICNGARGYLCPRLHTFIFRGGIYASVDTIRRFLTGKRSGHGIAGLQSWTEVAVNLMVNSVEPDCGSQMKKLVAEQQAAGLNVSLS